MEKSDNQDDKKEKPKSSNIDKKRLEKKVSEFDSMVKALMKVKPPHKD